MGLLFLGPKSFGGENMPKQKRQWVKKYPGIYFIEGHHPDGKPERIYYALYKRNGRAVEERIGAARRDKMTAAVASRIRVQRIDGAKSNKQRRDDEKARREAEEGRWTVHRIWNLYKENRGPDLKGLALDESRWRCWLEAPFGDKESAEIKPLDVDRLRLNITKTGKAPQTARNVLELLRRILNFGASRNDSDPLSFKIRLPLVNNERTEFLKPGELRRLLNTLDGWEDQQLAGAMLLALFSGLRKGEILRLEWKDVDFRNGLILLRDPKSGHDETIPLNMKARKLLKGHPRGKGGKVFQTKAKGSVSAELRRIREAAELPQDFRMFHGLRHHFASSLASSGKVDLFQLQRLLTHKSAKTTLRYAHLRDEALRAASNVMVDVLEEAGL